MKTSLRVLLYLTILLLALPLLASEEATFDRTLKVTGPVDLEVVTGSGNIIVRSGAAGTVSVHGVAKAGCCGFMFGQDPVATAKEIAANPPIEQTGNVVRVGHFGQGRRHDNVSISYELVVPAQTRLLSKTGSGNQEISGITGPAEVSSGSGDLLLSGIAELVRAHTGSGSITITDLHGSAWAHTGSGSIRGDRLGLSAADLNFDFETGSGGIHVNELRGALRAHTGSGRIEIDGQATGDWSLTTGSGGITVRLQPQAALDLNAHTSSGSIHTDRQVTISGSTSRHDLRGTVNGGGVHLDLRTGSGNIRIE